MRAGVLLTSRTICTVLTLSLSTACAARLGSPSLAAAHQIAFQLVRPSFLVPHPSLPLFFLFLRSLFGSFKNRSYSLYFFLLYSISTLHSPPHPVNTYGAQWLFPSYLADAVAVPVQSVLAGSLASEDHRTSRAVTSRAFIAGLGCGLFTALLLWAFTSPIAGLFTSDKDTLAALSTIWPYVWAAQPLNTVISPSHPSPSHNQRPCKL